MRIVQKGQELTFCYRTSDNVNHTLADHIDARILSTDIAGGFVGTTVGLYVTSNGTESKNYADFDFFYYK
jgi:alpha-N-arabinofuranosidase